MTDEPRSGPAARERPARVHPLLAGMTVATRPTGPIVAVVVSFVLLMGGGLVAALLFGSPLDGSVRADLGLLSAFPLTLLLLLAWVRWKEGRAVRTLGFAPAGRPAAPYAAGSPGRGAAAAVLRGAALALVTLSAVVLFGVGIGQLQFAPDGGDWVRWSHLGAVALLLPAFLVQGSTEEILTRGYLLQAVTRSWGLGAAVAVQTVFFVVLHMANPGGLNVLPILNLTLFSLFLAFWVIAEGGLWGVCAFHGVWNWAQGTLYGIPVSGAPLNDSLLRVEPTRHAATWLTGGVFGVEGSLVTTVLLAAGTLVALPACRRRASAASGAASPPAAGPGTRPAAGPDAGPETRAKTRPEAPPTSTPSTSPEHRKEDRHDP